MWIRPEDLHYYEEIGFEKFKIIDRLKNTDWLINAIEAYYKREYRGNLSDIICSFDTYKKEEIKTPKITENDITADNMQKLRSFWDLKPYIDNEKLTSIDFLKFFKDKRIDCRNQICQDCNYCNNVAKEAVKVDDENANNVVYNLDFIKQKLIDIVKE